MSPNSDDDSVDTPPKVRMPPGFKTVALNNIKKMPGHKKKRSDKAGNHRPPKVIQATTSDITHSIPTTTIVTFSERNSCHDQSTKRVSDSEYDLENDVVMVPQKVKLSTEFIPITRMFLKAIAFSLALMPTFVKIYESSLEFEDSTIGKFFNRQSIPFQKQFGNSELLMRVYFFIVPYIASSFCLILVHLLPNSSVDDKRSVPKFAMKLWHGQILPQKLQFPKSLVNIGMPDAFSIGEVIGVLVFLSLNLATIIVRVKRSLPRASQENLYIVDEKEDISAVSWPALEVWGKALGAVSIVNLGWYLLMPVGRKSVLLEALGLEWNRAIKYHRWVGFYSIFLMLLHGLFYVLVMIHGHGHPEYDPDGVMLKHNLWALGCSGSDNNECDADQRLRLRTNLYGVVSLVLVLEMGVFALPYFRRYLYEWFYYVHHLFILVLFFVCLHHKAAIIYLIPGVAIYTIDKLMGLNAYYNCCLAKTEMVSSNVLECSLKIDKSHFTYKAGQYVFVNVPSVSHLQWHPYYLTSGPNANPGKLFFHLKETGEAEESWSRKVVEAGRAGQLQMRIDAFYGNNGEKLAHKKAVVLVAGGVGITKMISLGMDLIQTQPDLPVTILWVCRTVQEFEIFSNMLCQAKRRTENLTVKVWITLSIPEPRIARGSVMSRDTDKEKCDLVMSVLRTPPLRKNKTMLFPSDEAKNHLFKTAAPGLEPLGNAVSMTIAIVFALAGYGASTSIARERGLEREGMISLIDMGIVMGLLIFIVIVLVLARPLLHSKLENENKGNDVILADCEMNDDSMESGSRGIDTDVYRDILQGRIGSRPDIQAEFDELASIHQRETNDDITTVGVLACGPKVIINATRAAVNNTVPMNTFSDALFSFVEEDWEL